MPGGPALCCTFYMKLAAFLSLAALTLLLAASNRSETNSLGIKLISIPAGSFEMGVDSTPLPASITKAPKGAGSDRPSNGDYDETPVHKVTISKSFLLSESEITIEQYRQYKPDYQGDPYYAPYASGISWDDAMSFCTWLAKKEGKPYRLPTEA